jgi:hypothetical protein
VGLTMWIARPKDDGSEEPESEIAIKKVLQDKRFKVCQLCRAPGLADDSVESRTTDHAVGRAPERCRFEGILLLKWRQGQSSEITLRAS